MLDGSGTLNVSIKSESPISRVRYVNNNSILTDNEQNRVFKKFIDFVERMLLFYSLDSRGYEGFTNGNEGVAEGIVNSGKVQDFQRFLKENDIDYELYGCEVDGKKQSTVILIIQMLISLRSPLPEPDHWHCSIIGIFVWKRHLLCL